MSKLIHSSCNNTEKLNGRRTGGVAGVSVSVTQARKQAVVTQLICENDVSFTGNPFLLEISTVEINENSNSNYIQISHIYTKYGNIDVH